MCTETDTIDDREIHELYLAHDSLPILLGRATVIACGKHQMLMFFDHACRSFQHIFSIHVPLFQI
jgi:hypothetical protein